MPEGTEAQVTGRTTIHAGCGPNTMVPAPSTEVMSCYMFVSSGRHCEGRCCVPSCPMLYAGAPLHMNDTAS